MVCPTSNVVRETRAHLPTHRAAALRRAIFHHSVRVVARCVVMACLAVAGVVFAVSNVVQYTYDAAGNVVAIQRINPAPITLTGLVPATGPVGAIIAITGTGFSATPADNAVAFNGVAAVVVNASPTALTVAVPAGATTGKVTVTVAANTAISAQDFVVAAAGMPTIAGFTPSAGLPGTTVNVDGTNFNPAAGATTVKLNQSPAPYRRLRLRNLRSPFRPRPAPVAFASRPAPEPRSAPVTSSFRRAASPPPTSSRRRDSPPMVQRKASASSRPASMA